jgi:hypothetical protein
MVELQPSKLIAWVRFPSPAPVWKAVANYQVARVYRQWLNPYYFDFAHIAQSVEHFLGKEEVIGSIPIMGSSIYGIFI